MVWVSTSDLTIPNIHNNVVNAEEGTDVIQSDEIPASSVDTSKLLVAVWPGHLLIKVLIWIFLYF